MLSSNVVSFKIPSFREPTSSVPTFSCANLQGVRLNDAYLVEADLMGANLSGAQPWKAKLYPCSNGRSEQLETLESQFKKVTDVSSLTKLCWCLAEQYPADNYALYF